jgi:hypothetical protein
MKLPKTWSFELDPGSEFLDYMFVVLECIPDQAQQMQNMISQGVANVLNRVDNFGVASEEFFAAIDEVLNVMFPDPPLAKIHKELRTGLKLVQEHLIDQGCYDEFGNVTAYVSGYTKPYTVLLTMFSGKERSAT